MVCENSEVFETLDDGDAECVAIGEWVKEATFVRNVLNFIQMSTVAQCIRVYEDDKGAISLANNPLISASAKHVGVRHHFLRELVATEQNCVGLVDSEEQPADVLTRSLALEHFSHYADILISLEFFKPPNNLLPDGYVWYF